MYILPAKGRARLRRRISSSSPPTLSRHLPHAHATRTSFVTAAWPCCVCAHRAVLRARARAIDLHLQRPRDVPIVLMHTCTQMQKATLRQTNAPAHTLARLGRMAARDRTEPRGAHPAPTNAHAQSPPQESAHLGAHLLIFPLLIFLLPACQRSASPDRRPL